ncbi:hypothetical protein DXX93_10365 [Thalassotalea euphylliae]|uniref:Uncharacterized protein n=1 Tax=Thalassotalea euphylliae TaxID=1655234 RepID=A0A3E0TSH8_9GAMM|nr:hypothetical protein [Thalassotalea euphylliae]REL26932.1 hypothetical protein DXX93_10365 [Thalassotalea euphylliae]
MDKPQDVGTDSKIQRVKDVIDFNHELAGGENGRIKRFSVDSPTFINAEEQEKRKSKERQFTDMLSYMLAHDAQYRQLYFDTESKLEEAESQVDEALLNISQELDDIKLQLENADELGLSEEERIELRRRKEELERQRQEIEEYQRNVIEHIRYRMNDKDNPPTKEELQQWQHMISDKMPESLNTYNTDIDAAIPSVSEQVHGKTELSSVKLCDEFCAAKNESQPIVYKPKDEPDFTPLSGL